MRSFGDNLRKDSKIIRYRRRPEFSRESCVHSYWKLEVTRDFFPFVPATMNGERFVMHESKVAGRGSHRAHKNNFIRRQL